LRGNAFGEQVGVGVARRRPQQIRNRVRDQPVDLLRHAPIAAAQARLQMHHRYPQLRPDHGTGGGCIDIAHRHDGIRAVALADAF
jgi:hypothetical protein